VNAVIYEGSVMHARLGAVQHRFEYPVWHLAVDLDALPRLGAGSRLFGYNQRALLSLWDRDYLDGEGSLRQRVDRHLAAKGLRAARVVLVTAPRFLGYVFNPVSFYYCYGADGALVAALAEVNNTFKEKHLYLLDRPLAAAGGHQARYTVPKAFHVSPFYDRSGDYDFHFRPLGEGLDIRIDILRDGKPAFVSRLWGKARPWSDAQLLKMIALKPWDALATYPRILWQAAKLHYQKRLPVFTKPYADSALTLRREPAGWWRSLQRDLVFKYFKKLKHGRLELTLPDRSVHVFGAGPGPQASMTVGNWSFFRRVITHGDVGLGESYQEGEWTSPDLSGVLRFFGANLEHADDRRHLNLAALGRAWGRVKHLLNANSLAGSRRNIEAHYDLSNDLYAKFLDGTWMYSCPVYEDLNKAQEEDLSAAQRRKIARLLEPLGLRAGQQLLEIGSGWGELAITAARDHGVRVTSLTLSQEQLKLAQERAAAAGVADRIDFVLRDYRQETGRYDAVVSCEMLEAVGHEHLPAYFAMVDRCLKPGGKASIQVITLPDARYEAYRRGTDWIQQHIFPGAVCPSVAALKAAMAQGSQLMIAQATDIGLHYAPTLRRWREAFLGARREIAALGFDDKFIRTWDYYFSYCEAGFAGGLLGDQQLVLERSAR
jgi:cyclopropane-fatty-acyl-phospholipid synthase